MAWHKLTSYFKDVTIQSIASNPNDLCWSANSGLLNINSRTPIVVLEGQIAVFLMNKQIVAILEKGTYPWHWVFDQTPTPDILANLSLCYFSTKTFLDQRWGTPSPILVHDKITGALSLRAHGAFSYHLDNPKKLMRHLPNELVEFSTEDILPALRSTILEQFAISLNNHDVQSLLKDRAKLSQQVSQGVAAFFEEQYGLTLKTFQVQSISLPEAEPGMDNLAKLEKLNELYRQGVLTEQEFEAKKKELLKGL